MMTRQHYEKIARILKNAPVTPEVRTTLAVQFAEWFEDDNSRFDADRFYAATGVE